MKGGARITIPQENVKIFHRVNPFRLFLIFKISAVASMKQFKTVNFNYKPGAGFLKIAITPMVCLVSSNFYPANFFCLPAGKFINIGAIVDKNKSF